MFSKFQLFCFASNLNLFLECQCFIDFHVHVYSWNMRVVDYWVFMEWGNEWAFWNDLWIYWMVCGYNRRWELYDSVTNWARVNVCGLYREGIWNRHARLSSAVTKNASNPWVMGGSRVYEMHEIMSIKLWFRKIIYLNLNNLLWFVSNVVYLMKVMSIKSVAVNVSFAYDENTVPSLLREGNLAHECHLGPAIAAPSIILFIVYLSQYIHSLFN